MLNTEEFDEIRGALTQIVVLNGRNYFQVIAGLPFMEALSKLAGPAASDEQVASGAIQVCMRREWRGTPCWLVRLLTEVKAQGGTGGVQQIATVDTIIERLNNRINVLDHVWYSHWVTDGLPF